MKFSIRNMETPKRSANINFKYQEKVEESQKPQSSLNEFGSNDTVKEITVFEVSSDSDSSDDDSSSLSGNNGSSAKNQSQIVFSKSGNLTSTKNFYNASTISQNLSASTATSATHM